MTVDNAGIYHLRVETGKRQTVAVANATESPTTATASAHQPTPCRLPPTERYRSTNASRHHLPLSIERSTATCVLCTLINNKHFKYNFGIPPTYWKLRSIVRRVCRCTYVQLKLFDRWTTRSPLGSLPLVVSDTPRSRHRNLSSSSWHVERRTDATPPPLLQCQAEPPSERDTRHFWSPCVKPKLVRSIVFFRRDTSQRSTGGVRTRDSLSFRVTFLSR